MFVMMAVESPSGHAHALSPVDRKKNKGGI